MLPAAAVMLMRESFGILLRTLRMTTRSARAPGDQLGRGMSQHELASRAGVDVAYVNRLEHGKQAPPSREVVGAFARAMLLDDQVRARLLVAAGYWPWPDQTADELDRAIRTARAVLHGDYRPDLAPSETATLEPP